MRKLLPLITLVLLAVTCVAQAQESDETVETPETLEAETPEAAETPDVFPTDPFLLTLDPAQSPDSIDADITDAKSRPAGLLPHGPVSLLDPIVKDVNRQLDRYGLKVGFAYTLVYQLASGGPGDRDAAGGDVDIFGDWRLLGEEVTPTAATSTSPAKTDTASSPTSPPPRSPAKLAPSGAPPTASANTTSR